jgi:CHAT domain-containing protein
MLKILSRCSLVFCLFSLFLTGNSRLAIAQSTDDNFDRFNIDPIKDFTIPSLDLRDIEDLLNNNNLDPNLILTIEQAQKVLVAIEEQAEEKPALIYVSFTPPGYQAKNIDLDFARREITNSQEYSQVGIKKENLPTIVNVEPRDNYILDLLLITGKEPPVRLTVPVTYQEVVANATDLWIKISDVFFLNDSYKPYATKLYSWLIEPLESELKKRKISNLLFILPTEIRFTPMSALYDANEAKFLVEKYSSGLAPSLNLNNNLYRPIKDLKLLTMGASNFADPNVVPLPAVSLELPTVKQVWGDESVTNYQPYINQNFTFSNLQANLDKTAYGIVHLGTHGDFNPDQSEESFIQLYNAKLELNKIRELGLNEPLVELMVLSACETAFGDEMAELGFAGLAVQAGVKTAMGTVWQVSDTGTLALMTDFYQQLKMRSTKGEALRQAQLNMLYQRVYKTQTGDAIITPKRQVSLQSLPAESRYAEDFSHPFYWAPFTMIGNPW